jgi:hypothetical protein
VNASGLDDKQMLYAEVMSGVHMGIVTSSESRSDSRPIYFPVARAAWRIGPHGQECGIGFGPNRCRRRSSTGARMGSGSMWPAVLRPAYGPHRRPSLSVRRAPRHIVSEGDEIRTRSLGDPGAKVLNEGNALPATDPSAHLSWRRTTQSNLYRVALPN